MSGEGLSWNDLPPKIHNRRKKITHLQRSNLSIPEIAVALDVSEMTIRRDIAWLEQAQMNVTKSLNSSQRISQTLALLQEIEDKSMVLCQFAMDRELVVDDLDGDGRLIKTKKKVPDNHAASKHLQDAMKARMSAESYLHKLGKLNPFDEDEEKGLSIAEMTQDELVDHIKTQKTRIAEIQAKIERYNAPSVIKEMPKGWERRLIGEK